MLLRMEEIDLKVGQGESFLERMLPVVSASVKYISRDSIDTIDFSLPTDLHRAFTRQRRKQAPSSLLSDSGTSFDGMASTVFPCRDISRSSHIHLSILSTSLVCSNVTSCKLSICDIASDISFVH